MREVRKDERMKERKTQSKPGQTGPRLAEVASGPQTINKERSNLWTGSLISTLLLFSHLIDGLQCRFVLPPLLLVQQLLFYPAFLPSFLSFSREINTHSWTGRATGESRRFGDELREDIFWMGKKLRNAKYYCVAPPPSISQPLTLIIISTRAHWPNIVVVSGSTCMPF